MPINHLKTNQIADWTQAELDAQIAQGFYPPGTTLADITLPSDWNDTHTNPAIADVDGLQAALDALAPGGSTPQLQYNNGGVFAAAPIEYRTLSLSTGIRYGTDDSAGYITGSASGSGSGGVFMGRYNTGMQLFVGYGFTVGSGYGVTAGSDVCIGFSSAAVGGDIRNTDTGFRRVSAGVVALGNSGVGDTSGTLTLANVLVSTAGTSSTSVVAVAATQTLTNKRITKRSNTLADATSITPAGDTTDIAYQLNTQSAGTFTVNAPTGTPTEGQSLLIKIKSTNAQTFSWNAIYTGGTVALPTATSGSSLTDYYSFIYDSVASKWRYTGTAGGFA